MILSCQTPGLLYEKDKTLINTRCILILQLGIKIDFLFRLDDVIVLILKANLVPTWLNTRILKDLGQENERE